MQGFMRKAGDLDVMRNKINHAKSMHAIEEVVARWSKKGGKHLEKLASRASTVSEERNSVKKSRYRVPLTLEDRNDTEECSYRDYTVCKVTDKHAQSEIQRRINERMLRKS